MRVVLKVFALSFIFSALVSIETGCYQGSTGSHVLWSFSIFSPAIRSACCSQHQTPSIDGRFLQFQVRTTAPPRVIYGNASPSSICPSAYVFIFLAKIHRGRPWGFLGGSAGGFTTGFVGDTDAMPVCKVYSILKGILSKAGV